LKPHVPIGDAESRVLAVLWREGPATSERVIAALAQEHWQVSAIKTLLARLVKKRALRAKKVGRRFIYSAALTRQQWVTSESEGLLSRVFDGRVAPLVQHFSQHRRLSKADIAELKRLIEEMDDDE
jgi:predicted transcriptional regulator